MIKIKIAKISIEEIENNKTKKVKVASKIKLVAPLKEINSEYWDKVKVGNDWDREYQAGRGNELPIMLIMTSRSRIQPWDKCFKNRQYLDGFKKYADGDSRFYRLSGGEAPKIKDISLGNWFAPGRGGTNSEKKLTQFLREANKMFHNPAGYGKLKEKEAFEFLKSIIESPEIKSQVKFVPDDEITLGEWLKYRDSSNNNDQIELTEKEAIELGISIQQQPSSSPQPTLPSTIPTEYQQIIDDLRQKYNDSQTDLNTTKDKLAKEQADKHLLELKVTDLNSEITRNNDRITQLEARPNITNDQWINDYSQRPTLVELDKVKAEWDQRPAVSLEDYQKLLDIKTELGSWTKVFPNEGAQEINDLITKLRSDIKEWTDTFKGEIPFEVNDRINYLTNNQEKHTSSDLKPANLPSDWEQQLNRLPGLEQRPNIPITEAQWNSDYKDRPTLTEHIRVKDELSKFNNLQSDYDKLRNAFLRHKIKVINENWIALTNRLGVVWDKEIEDTYKSHGKDLDDLINQNLSLTNLGNDKMFGMAEYSVKRVIFLMASQKAEKSSETSKQDLSNLTRGQKSELVNMFEKLVDLGVSELKDVPDIVDNPFYLDQIEKEITRTKTKNAHSHAYWKKQLEWDSTTRHLEEEETESLIEYPEQK